jgi:hypothetical protein
MSHFTVLVKLTPDKMKDFDGDVQEAVSALLAPFQENNMGDCPEEYLEFRDHTEEVDKGWDEDTSSMVKMPDGELVDRHDKRFQVPVNDEDQPWRSTEFKLPEGCEEVEIPVKEVYANKDEYAEDYHGSRDEKTGKFGYWENPNRKWDWWQIGGRWRGLLKVKAPEMAMGQGAPGVPELMSGKAREMEETACDVAKVGDLDLEAFREKAEKNARGFLKKIPAFKRMADDRKRGNPGLNTGDDYDQEAADAYYESIAEEFGVDKKEVNWLHHDVWGTAVENGMAEVVRPDKEDRDTWYLNWAKDEWTEEEFVEEFAHIWEFGTFAVLDDEGWHEKGEMGWFACSSETPEEAAQWNKSYTDTHINSSDPETTLVVVDCHI